MARHYNPRARESSHMHRTGVTIYRPYQRLYSYTKPSMNFKYMKAIQFVADHPGCKRTDILAGVWGVKHPEFCPGYMSQVFANLLYDDWIDYDENFRYTVTPGGKGLLEEAYLNDMEKLCKKARDKQMDKTASEHSEKWVAKVENE